MKHVVFLCDGMADYPSEILNGKTPLTVSKKPHMDALCQKGTTGLVKTVADNLNPGSDVANLSVIGYNPTEYYTGRSPLEALSIGVTLDADDVTFRANVVTLSDEGAFEKKRMKDYSAGEISTKEAHVLINYLRENMHFDHIFLYGGTSYRHLMVHKFGSTNIRLTPPHDISDQCIENYLPNGDNSDLILEIMKKSYALLKDHPINTERIKRGLNPANCLWIWGEGTKPNLTLFAEKYKKRAAMISAVDLLKGIGHGCGMEVIEVEGATGTVDTNFPGKADAAIKALADGYDFVYIHMEAPDECGHHGDMEGKIKSIELIDEQVIAPVTEFLNKQNEPYRVLILPDHPTPIATKTHARDAVPFVMYDSKETTKSGLVYNEETAKTTGIFIEPGYKLMEKFLNNAEE